MYFTRYTNAEAVGYLVAKHIRCGKPGCHCCRDQGHGPYWYLHFRRFEAGRWRPRKRYVPTRQLAAVQAVLGQAKARDRALATLLRTGRRLRSAVRSHKQGKITRNQLERIFHGIAANRDDQSNL